MRTTIAEMEEDLLTCVSRHGDYYSLYPTDVEQALQNLRLEWFKKGLQHAYCNVMELDPLGTYAYLEDMYEETDAGTIGPLKKEEV